MQALARASLAAPPVVLRVKSAEACEEAARRLELGGVRTHRAKFSPLALVVDYQASRNRGAELEANPYDAIREAGVIQDEASQLVAQLLEPGPGELVLDLCAAPGIKTGQIAQALGQGKIVAADRSVARVRTMRRLLKGIVPPEVEVLSVRLDASAKLPFKVLFDRILVDAPCSGTGTLSRNPEIKLRLGPEDLPRLAGIQERMLGQALEALAVGGRLVYATCSLEPEENEKVVEKVLSNLSGFRIVSRDEHCVEFPAWSALLGEEGFLRTRPDRDGMDGFFAAVIERQL